MIVFTSNIFYTESNYRGILSKSQGKKLFIKKNFSCIVLIIGLIINIKTILVYRYKVSHATQYIERMGTKDDLNSEWKDFRSSDGYGHGGRLADRRWKDFESWQGNRGTVGSRCRCEGVLCYAWVN